MTVKRGAFLRALRALRGSGSRGVARDARRDAESVSHGDAESAESVPGRAAFVSEQNLPRPDPRSCRTWFLPVESMLIPPRSVPGEASSTPRTQTRPEQTTTLQDP